MSDTPETDKLDDDMGNLSPDQECDYRFMMRHARKLERERDRARAEAERWRDNWKKGRTMSMIVSTDLPWENAKADSPAQPE